MKTSLPTRPRALHRAPLPAAAVAMRALLWLGAALLALGALTAPARAQDTDADPPGRAARLSEVAGQVWLYNPDAGEWIAAVRNQPLTSGDRLATDAGARAELQIGSTSVRLDASSELELVQLDEEHAALQLHAGSAIAQVRDPAGAGEFALETEDGRFIVQGAGSYRFDRGNGKTEVTVYRGQARYEGPNSALPVSAGQRAEFWIDSGGIAQYTLLQPVNDAFSAWSGERDRRAANSVSERYVSPEISGVAELDAYGRWEQDPEYGAMWIPTRVAADWAPYSQGHWAWVRPWGWTWVDDAPWGFAPFHYGRWVYARNNWCWTPGTRVRRPVYAPALVGWIGGPRGGVSISVGGPAVGWFPLAPREVYVPSYRVSPRYARDVNFTAVANVTLINNVFSNPQGPRDFRNRGLPRAVTVVPSGVFTERRPVGPAAAQYRQAPWVRELAGSPGGRTPVLLAPPVVAPSLPARRPDFRDVRPPPGAGDRPRVDGRAGTLPAVRERNEPERGIDRRFPGREAERPDMALPGRTPGGGAVQPGAVVRPPVLPAPATAGTPPAVESRRPDGDFRNRDNRDNRDYRDNRGESQRPPLPERGLGRDERRPAPAVQPAPPVTIQAPAPAAPPAPVAQPAPPQPQPQPTMRAFPVQRGEDRRVDERRPQPARPEMPAAPVVRPPAPVAPMPQRAPEPPRPAEAPRVAPPPPVPPQAAQPAAPAPQRPEVRNPRADNPREEPRRGDPREQQR